MPPPSHRRTAAIARLAGIAATMAAAPAVAVIIAGSAQAAQAPVQQSADVGTAARAHLSTLLGPGVTTERLSADQATNPHVLKPNPFHQFQQFHQGPFRQGSPFGQDIPFHQAPGDPFQELSEP
ncbi:hypothetical protein GPX89_36930 [Nocardia sp. ET3-3]|uniref:Serine protease n=1 Tax=Nocardia terrae TaxID=2675851 RepID=A0A7K1V8E1_9NOCA|nr:hypothetical protein [Nocardia terrae]MVU82807.1 hypothetical protein [Nocardia terrae]